MRRPSSLAALLAATFLTACAIVSRPKGGLVDTRGPVLDTLLSSPNFQTDASPTELRLIFDEYVALKDANREIVLTPTPVEGRARYVQRGREVRVDLSDVVYRDSTTYQIQFGQAVQDFNEGNPAASLRYVFSTGPALDSLTLAGTVRQSLDDAPVIGALVALYRSDSDTALTQATPDYFVRTDSSGRYAFDYLAPGDFQLAAYRDENRNFRLNVGAEAVAFLDTLVPVHPGLPDTAYTLTLSAERPPLVALRGEQTFPGLLRFTLNQPATRDVTLRAAGVDTVLARYVAGDTLGLAYAPARDSLAEVVLLRAGESDTVRLRGTPRAVPPVRPRGRATGVEGSRALAFDFSLPLAGVDTTLIRVAGEADSTAYPPGRWRRDPTDPRRLRWLTPTDTVAGFRVSWLPGALRTVFDSTNRDTLRAEARAQPDAEFALLDLRLPGLDSTRAYAFELVDAQGAASRTTALAPGDTAVTLRRVAPGTYRLRLIDDADADGRYSPGDRGLRRQPERVRYFPLEQLRADWTVEQRVLIDDEG